MNLANECAAGSHSATSAWDAIETVSNLSCIQVYQIAETY